MGDRDNGRATVGEGDPDRESPPFLTPRQAQILDLAATGLSDKEIARRLNVTHRTVRSHFEKLFKDRGIRNRSQAIAIWSGSKRPRETHPADECPYPKPFPPGFSECPAYQASQMVTLDLSGHPLGAIWTCRHLVSRLVPSTDYHWYGACLVGDAEARRRWSNAVGVDRLQEISRLRQEISALSGPYMQRLLELNESGAEKRPADAVAMQALRAQFMRDMTTLLTARRQVLDELHLPLEACLQVVRLAMDRFVEQGLGEADWEVPDEVLTLFPADVRAYFRPGTSARPTDGGSVSRPATAARRRLS